MDILKNNTNLSKTIDLLGLWSIGIICFLYSLFWSDFAEIHITFPFLNFPIFVGEFLLLWCVILLFLKWRINGVKFNYKYCLLLMYVLWVLYKTFVGYLEGGPLALRNAALFYYPFFIFLGYYFYRNDFFSQKAVYAIFLILVATKMARGENFVYYFFPPYVFLSIALILKMKRIKIRYIAMALLIYSFQFQMFFQGSRSYLIANLVAFIFLALCFIFGVSKLKTIVKISTFIAVLSVFLLAVLKFVSPEKMKSILTLPYLIAQIQSHKQLIAENRKNYVYRDIPVKVYDPNKTELDQNRVIEQLRIKAKYESKNNMQEIMKEIAREAELQALVTSELKKNQQGIAKIGPNTADQDGIMTINEPQIEQSLARKRIKDLVFNKVHVIMERVKRVTQEVDMNIDEKREWYAKFFMDERGRIREEVFAVEESTDDRLIYFEEQFDLSANAAILKSEIKVLKPSRNRGMQNEYGNILFRILIWSDMIEELKNEKPWFGFSFGKAQRSISLESSSFAVGEWGRDGWIAPHNAFLHMIYRAGILGIFMIACIFAAMFVIIRELVKRRSLIGLFLVSILVYWLTSSNFLVVLELPYQAIPFWTLFGMIFAYFFKSRYVQTIESGVNWQQG